MSRRRVLLLCGGRSDEHEVSLASAASVLAATRDRLDVTPLVLDRDGRPLPAELGRAALERAAGESLGALADGARTLAGRADLPAVASSVGAEPGFDVVFPLLHGPYGEDGTVQGLLELTSLPYVGSGVLGSAVGMDKPTMKAVFAAHGLPQVRHGMVNRHAWRQRRDATLEQLTPLPWPRFVKPANLGSSVGISRADDPHALAAALDEALRYDRRAIVEEGLVGARELEVAVLGNDDPRASPVGEIRFDGSFYDYATKYTDGAAELVIPAAVPPAVAERCRTLALRAFAAVDAAGLARVDFFWRPGRSGDDPETVLLNEINTMPGFTRTSMYPKLWQAAGLSYDALVEKLVELALERHVGARATAEPTTTESAARPDAAAEAPPA